MRGFPLHVRLAEDGASLVGDVDAVVDAFDGCRRAVALTGAGVSVESGIPDFRSPGGLWSEFDPADYATLSCFVRTPERAWELYRALGKTIFCKQPNPAHRALSDLERDGTLTAVITQNVDGLHQAAGSRNVLEVHGEHRHLQCLECGRLEAFEDDHLEPGPVPACASCGAALKPNVVLFEEPVRDLPAIQAILTGCDVMLVAGTSAEVVPASLFPETVRSRGGVLLEFNHQPTQLTDTGLGGGGVFVEGPVGKTLPLVSAAIRARRARGSDA